MTQLYKIKPKISFNKEFNCYQIIIDNIKINNYSDVAQHLTKIKDFINNNIQIKNLEKDKFEKLTTKIRPIDIIALNDLNYYKIRLNNYEKTIDILNDLGIQLDDIKIKETPGCININNNTINGNNNIVGNNINGNNIVNNKITQKQTKLFIAEEWIKKNLPEIEELTTEYYNKYIAYIEENKYNKISVQNFTKLVENQNYLRKKINNSNHIWYKNNIAN